MRHRVSGRQLSRTTSHRRALRRNQAASLFEHGAIRTTEAKAKELRRFVERLITIARQGTIAARRQVTALLRDRFMVDENGDFLEQTVVQKLFADVAPKYADRPGGYTRIIRLSDHRIGDGGTTVLLQLVEKAAKEDEDASKSSSSRRKKRAAKRIQAAEGASEAKAEEKKE
jgi:large subunit ribosomal protein L17